MKRKNDLIRASCRSHKRWAKMFGAATARAEERVLRWRQNGKRCRQLPVDRLPDLPKDTRGPRF